MEHDDDDDESSMSSSDALTEVIHLDGPDVRSTAEATHRPGKDGRFGGICIVLSHVTKNQDIVRTSLETEFRFTCVVDKVRRKKQPPICRIQLRVPKQLDQYDRIEWDFGNFS